MAQSKIPRLETGTKYRVVYVHDNVDWSFLGTYLGENEYTGEFTFYLDPAESIHVEPINMVEAWEMPHTSVHQPARRRF